MWPNDSFHSSGLASFEAFCQLEIMRIQLKLEDLIQRLPEAKVKGAFDGPIVRIAALDEARQGDLSFLSHPRYQSKAKVSSASVILVPADYEAEPHKGQAFLQVANPSAVITQLCSEIAAANKAEKKAGIHPSAVVDPSAEVSATAWVGPQCVVEAGARIEEGAVLRAQVYVGRQAVVGRDSELRPQVVVDDFCRIGKRCLLHAGVVIGADGFGYDSSAEGHRKIPQVGIAVIEDDVEIGANSTVDRARFAETRIGRGSKLDNLVQVGHNVIIGEHSILCAFAGIAGSSQVGKFVTLAGQVGVVGHIKIGDGVMVGGQAGVSQDLEAGKAYTGTPARELKEQRRLEAWVRKLPQMGQDVKELKKMLSES